MRPSCSKKDKAKAAAKGKMGGGKKLNVHFPIWSERWSRIWQQVASCIWLESGVAQDSEVQEEGFCRVWSS